MMQSTLTNPARQFFDDNGYYLERNVYSEREILRLEEEFDRIVDQVKSSASPYSGPNAAEHNGIISTTNVHKYSAVWLIQGLLHDGFLDAAEQFLGPDIVLQRSSLYEKRQSNVVGPFRMHQDWIYGPMCLDSMVSGMIHVRRATGAMGALRIYPGTHLSRIENSRADDSGTAFHDKFPLEQSTVLEANAGDVLFFHYCLVHGSMSNQTNEPRKVVHVRMFSGQDRQENENQPFENIALRGWNSHADVHTTASNNT
jgi:phytanoyl-CoA hydroxylase